MYNGEVGCITGGIHMVNKRKIIITFIIFTTFMSMFILSQAATEVTLSIDGEILDSSNNPILEDGRTIAPVRVISEYLGAFVGWDGSTKTVFIDKGDNHIELSIDNQSVIKNGQNIQLDTPPQLINSTTYVPLRFVSEVLDYEVGWNGELKRVELNTPLLEEDTNEENSEKFTIKSIAKLRIEEDFAVFIDVGKDVKY